MLEKPEMYIVELRKVSLRAVSQEEPAFQEGKGRPSQRREHFHLLKQLTRFGLVGGLNTLIDIVALNFLLFLWPTSNTPRILIYNALAYAVGAGNSFVCNKYWTFQRRQSISRSELLRFALTTLAGMVLNSTMLWLAGLVLRELPLNTTLWANASKVLAISATMLVSYLGMRLWVFASKAQAEPLFNSTGSLARVTQFHPRKAGAAQTGPPGEEASFHGRHSLSVVLPAYNEESTGAHPRVVMRALFVYTRRWKRADRLRLQQPARNSR